MSEETKDTEVAAVDAADEPRGQSKPVIDSAEALARALGGTRQNGNQWLAPCPVPTHGKGKGDRKPSLSLRDGTRPARCWSIASPAAATRKSSPR